MSETPRRQQNSSIIMLRDTNNKIINDTKLLFNKMQVDGPVDVGTDDKGIFESVIELDIYYER